MILEVSQEFGMKKRVLIITYYWPPSGGAGVQRWLKFSKYLPDFDWEPIILTVDPEKASYAQWDQTLSGDIREDLKVYHTLSLEPYSIYRMLSSRKEIPYGGFSNEGKPSRFQKISRFIRGNFFLPDPRRGWNIFAVKAAKKIIEEQQVNMVITTGPPHSTHLIGRKLKNDLGIRWCADFRDPWTNIYYYDNLYHTKWAKSLDRKMEQSVLSRADAVVTVSQDIRELLRAKVAKADADKFHVISNGYDYVDFDGLERQQPDRFTITYTGTVAPIYRAENFAKAAARFKQQIDKPFRIRFVGKMDQHILSVFKKQGLEDELDLVSYVPHNEAVSYMLNASVLLLLIPDVANNKGIVTGKFFEYLATGNPMLVMGPEDGEVAALLKETGAGEIFNPDRIDAIEQQLMGYFEQYKAGILGKVNPAIEPYSRKALSGRLAEALNRCI